MGSQNTKFQNSQNLCLWVESKFSKRESWKIWVVHYLKSTVTAIQCSLVISVCDKSTFSDDILLVFCHMRLVSNFQIDWGILIFSFYYQNIHLIRKGVYSWIFLVITWLISLVTLSRHSKYILVTMESLLIEKCYPLIELLLSTNYWLATLLHLKILVFRSWRYLSFLYGHKKTKSSPKIWISYKHIIKKS